MPETQRRLILANAEGYVHFVEKARNNRPPTFPRTYEEARQLVKSEVTSSLARFAALPTRKKFDDETFLCLRLHPDKAAKTYDPSGIFGTIQDLENVGSRDYRTTIASVAQTERIKKLDAADGLATGRLVFVRSTRAGFERLIRTLDEPIRNLSKSFCQEIQCIERFDLLGEEEQLLGFSSDWEQGRVELVLHPSEHSEASQMDFINRLFERAHLEERRIRIAPYSSAPTFVSCYIDHAALIELAGANPLRAAHPINFDGVESLRGFPRFDSPPPPTTSTRSIIKVGIFDGGIDPNHPLLKNHIEEDHALSIDTPPNLEYVAHGTAVAGVVLHGPLNEVDTTKPLPEPPVSVVSVRVLPTKDPKDPDLYECIDLIEAAVPARPDVKVWNVSFGPRGPILDDSISRFTYALDTLSAAHKVAFCVAVGNDGEAGPGLSRVQSPSDLANGLGVGAYTERGGQNVHAPYSCSGPGRECAKVKPDLVAFGGCATTPIHLIDATHGRKVLSRGTSFAAPQASTIAAEISGRLEKGTTLLARALMIHSAVHPDGEPDHLLGHGILSGSLNDALRCNEKEVTIIFQKSLAAKQQIKLPLLLPANVISSGKLFIRWTVACLPPVSPSHPSDYTGICLQDTFYPNDQVYSFSRTVGKKVKTRKLHEITQATQITELVQDGWKKSSYPAAESGNAYPTEAESRALDYKWEPIVRKGATKYANSLRNPFLILHAIPRHKNATARLDYAVVVTICAPKFTGDLYDTVLRRFTALQPVRLRTEADLRVKI